MLVTQASSCDWNHVRPFIARKSREAIGRDLNIAGDLRVRW